MKPLPGQDPLAVVGGQRTGETELLARVAGLMKPHLKAHVNKFYATLGQRPGPARVIELLSSREFAHLKAVQVEHLRFLLDPGTDLAAVVDRGRDVGRVHAMAGVEMDWYAEAIAYHQRGIFETVAPRAGSLDLARAIVVLNERFLADLKGELQGYRDIDAAQVDVVMQVSEAVARARTLPDLTRDVLEALGQLGGMVSAFIGRPDSSGDFALEAGVGDGVDELIAWSQSPDASVVSTSTDTPLGRGPAGQAWRSEEIVRCDSYQTDPDTEPWWAWGERFGWRASAAVPLVGANGRPRAMLSLFAAWPGYFSYGARATMLKQVKGVVERGLEDLESRPNVAARVQSYGARASHLARLRAGEVEMLFQPVVALPTGKPLKFEALARLRDDDQLVTPADFLPAFGDEELLRLFEIGLDQSLSALEEWDRQGITTEVSVNMPVLSARDERYLQTVADALARHAVAPHRLTLELLETGHMDGTLTARKAGLDNFKRMGVRLAQDDLGSGYSSLLRLRHFDFDIVKIDQSLIQGTHVDPRAALQFVQPISDIAHNLGLHVTLEGLETPGLIEAAAQLGVDSGQGYAIARPMPRDAVPGWAAGFGLSLDPEQPRTELGGLAAHVAWEHRMTAFGASPARQLLVDSDMCGLAAYLREQHRHDRDRLETLHAEVHAEAFARRAGPAHRKTWDRLVSALGEG